MPLPVVDVVLVGYGMKACEIAPSDARSRRASVLRTGLRSRPARSDSARTASSTTSLKRISPFIAAPPGGATPRYQGDTVNA
ncbi:hypothetical protein [Burkholderia gladioli]|uniref:hypothetical protein n=1 Tax=Burkholderia gladioli TaxID=28095 RepID=UPI0006273394|nr:hypothetical protein [Burkholderia gladioli]KKJ06063.1 hypothetical protein XF14_13800 [Burkholderia gladioli]